MQDLAGVGARRQDRVVAELAGVAVAGALLGVPIDLSDERVDVDHQPRRARSGARLPRARRSAWLSTRSSWRTMAERERAQKRPERRGRHRPMPKDRLGPPRPEHVAVIDAVSA